MEVVDKVVVLNKALVFGSKQEKLNALKEIDAKLAVELFDSIVALTNHLNVEIRVAALRALRFSDPAHLVEVIRDNLHDESKEVRLAASELFHLHDLAA